jgi:hypothetical protein
VSMWLRKSVLGSVLVWLLLHCAYGFSGEERHASPLPRESTIPKSAVEIFPSQEGIRLVITSCPLGEVLKDIERRSGIVFEISSRKAQETITRTFTASDWKTAVNELLRNYSRVALLNTDQTLRRVLILNTSGEQRSLPKKFIGSPPPPPPPPTGCNPS